MDAQGHHEVTVLLERIRGGDESATGELLGLTYNELRALAGHIWRDQAGDHTLQPTALVNEACMRLLNSTTNGWNDRKHFFRVAARAMRNLLTDHARASNAQRRGGKSVRVSLDSPEVPAAASDVDLVVLNDTLAKLSHMDERLGLVFELRFLLGLSVAQTAEIAEVSARSVNLDTQFIRAWLTNEMTR